MALCAERDEVLIRVVTGVTAKPLVVDFQIRHRVARLTPPAIAAQDLLAKSLIGQRVSRKRGSFEPIELTGCIIREPPVLLSAPQRQSPNSNSLFFDDDDAAFAQRLLHHRHSP